MVCLTWTKKYIGCVSLACGQEHWSAKLHVYSAGDGVRSYSLLLGRTMMLGIMKGLLCPFFTDEETEA